MRRGAVLLVLLATGCSDPLAGVPRASIQAEGECDCPGEMIVHACGPERCSKQVIPCPCGCCTSEGP